jgi:rhomboid protease GluP
MEVAFEAPQSHSGAFAEATEILKRYETTKTPLGRLAAVQLYRMNNRWEDLLAWFEHHLPRPEFQHDPAVLSLYLRALGETGNPNDLLRAYNRFEKIIERTGPSAVLSRLVVFAFCGRKEQVARLFQGPLKVFPQPVQKFWLATVDLATGNEAAGRRQLVEVLESDDILIRVAAERRLSHPLPVGEAVLTPESRPILARVELAQDQAERFGGLTHAGRTTAYVTYGLIGLNLLMFGLEIFLGGSQNIYTLYRMGALAPEAVVAGEWQRLLASMFLHYGFLHLLMNMLALYILGPFVEFAVGARRYSLVYFASGLGAALLVVLLVLQGLAEKQLLVGASGGIMGLVGATAAILLRGWRVERASIASKRLIVIVTIILVQVFMDLLMPQVSFTAHFSGLVTGFVLASLLRHRVSRTGISNQ